MNHRKLIIVGDTHGTRINELMTPNADIIHVGDYGMGFACHLNEYLGKNLNRIISMSDSNLYVNRGNHDDPYFWKNVEAANQFDRVKFVPSYTIKEIQHETFLFLGGALSVDRQDRKLGRDYWKDEAFDYDPSKLKDLAGIENVTSVISHTAPAFCPPVEFNGFVEQFFIRDLHLKSELIVERNNMSETFFDLKEKCPKLKNWYFGHFHPRITWTQTLHNVSFTCLAIDDFTEI